MTDNVCGNDHSQRVIAIIGSNFGDEGKGLATDHFCSTAESSLVIRHNGGAQAGHTVEYGEKRFVFHQLSSGSFRRADTLLAETFLPDMFKLEEEISGFYSISGFVPKIYADVNARVTTVDDVLVNMALETSRGENRHGSCGMGINEAVLRSGAGFGITVGELSGMTSEQLVSRLIYIRREYVYRRLEELGLADTGEYDELLHSRNVLMNAAEGMIKGSEYVIPVTSPEKLLSDREKIVFEGAQGLLLDSENRRFVPHVTASRTGLYNPLSICKKSGIALDMAVYVLRSYVTRHGAGPLPNECEPEKIGNIGTDLTNKENRWQGSIRYGFYESPKSFAENIINDMSAWNGKAALFVTHLNETNGFVRFSGENIRPEELIGNEAFSGRISRLYCSYSSKNGWAPPQSI